jgi:acyl phosphate:glycerol-3-phosphate acyltransferase
VIESLVVLVLGYLVGAFPTGFVVTRAVAGSDIRSFGSGGTGATNVQRVLGWRWGLAIALADIVKGIAAVVLARALSESTIVVALAASLAVAGHCWPIWLRFRGGKGVATGAGAAFALSPWGLLLIPVLVLPVLLTRYVSLGSLVAACVAPLLFAGLALAGAAPSAYVAFGVVAASIIVFKHRSNIERLRAGTERRVGRAIARA